MSLCGGQRSLFATWVLTAWPEGRLSLHSSGSLSGLAELGEESTETIVSGPSISDLSELEGWRTLPWSGCQEDKVSKPGFVSRHLCNLGVETLIKGDNLGDADKLYLTLYEVDSLRELQNGAEARNFIG